MVNMQANDNFASHQLNRDTWSDSALSEIIKSNFVFVQIMAESAFGQSVCSAYRLTETPAILVVDPETRAKVKQWTGFIAPDQCVGICTIEQLNATTLCVTCHVLSSRITFTTTAWWRT